MGGLLWGPQQLCGVTAAGHGTGCMSQVDAVVSQVEVGVLSLLCYVPSVSPTEDGLWRQPLL